MRSCSAPGPARTREAARGAHTACPPARRPRPPRAPREGARFTYGVYLQEPLEVPDAVYLTVRQPLNDLAGDLGFLQAEQHGQRPGPPRAPGPRPEVAPPQRARAPRTQAARPPARALEPEAGVGLGETPISSSPAMSALCKKKALPTIKLKKKKKKKPLGPSAPGCRLQEVWGREGPRQLLI